MIKSLVFKQAVVNNNSVQHATSHRVVINNFNSTYEQFLLRFGIELVHGKYPKGTNTLSCLW